VDTPRSQRSTPTAEPDVLGMKFVPVPKGTFWMGGGGGTPGERQMTIEHDFWAAIHPVTQGQWQGLMGNNPSYFSRTGECNDKVKDVSDADLVQLPVERVSWHDAKKFIEKLNEKFVSRGWLYRLPTEAEWEYICRGAATTKSDCAFDFYLDRPTNALTSTQA